MAFLTRRFPEVRGRRLMAVGALISLLSAAALAEPLTSIPNPRTRDGTWVTDLSGTLRAETIARLNSSIGDFERTNGAEMAVVVIRSLDGLTIEEASVKLFELWKIGKASRDNGLLLLWSTGDRRVRVEVGYGLEGVLPDGKVGAILDAHVMPKFRSGEFDEGVLAGVDALLRAARDEPMDLPSPRSDSYGGEGSGAVAVIIGLVAGLPFAVVGSIVGFRKWRRRHRRRCPQCRTLMTLVDESHDNALLEGGQQAEERVKSVDYDVWKCRSCGHHFSLRYPKWFSSYEQCPQCHHRTKSSTEKVVTAATTSSSGSALVVETCAFCTFHREHTKVLPLIDESHSSSGGSSSGSSGGGSGSFGGGGSGGGGASRGY